MKSEYNDTGGAFLHAAGSLKTDHVLNMAVFYALPRQRPERKMKNKRKGARRTHGRESETRNVTKPADMA